MAATKLVVQAPPDRPANVTSCMAGSWFSAFFEDGTQYFALHQVTVILEAQLESVVDGQNDWLAEVSLAEELASAPSALGLLCQVVA